MIAQLQERIEAHGLSVRSRHRAGAWCLVAVDGAGRLVACAAAPELDVAMRLLAEDLENACTPPLPRPSPVPREGRFVALTNPARSA